MNRESKRHQEREEQRVERVAPTSTSAPTEKQRTSPGQFLREVRSELKKVNWPSRSEVVNYSIVVLVTTLVLTLLTWAMDWVFSNAVINLFE